MVLTPSAYAEVSKGTSLSSDSFRILDSQHSVFGAVASSSSSSFLLTSVIGDLAIGSASANSFGLRSGFLYYPKVVAPILYKVVAKNSGAFLSWIPAFAYQGFSIGGYNVCAKLTSGGTYSCQNVGNVIFYEKSSLTNDSDYTFKVEAKDNLGNVIAVSNERSATPASTGVAEAAATTTTFSTATSNTLTLTNSNSTTVVFDFLANFYSNNVQLSANSFPNNYFASTKPAPSGKSFIGKTYDFNVAHSTTSDQISTISSPATITLSYLSSDVSGFSESSLTPYRWGTNDSSWQLISGATVNTANKTVTFSTANFSSFALFGTTSTTAPSSGGGGGGGGGYSVPSGNGIIIIKGTAYPKSTINILLDGIVVSKIDTSSNARFEVTLNNVPAGSRLVNLFSTDTNNRKSITTSFAVTVTAGTTITLANILMPPTIDVSSTNVARGQSVKIFGYAEPTAEVNIHVASEETVTKIISDSNGAYALLFDTKPLTEDEHITKSRAVFESSVSPFSHVLQFFVGKGGTLKTADLNKDGRVNIIDFSIFLFWWNTKQAKGLKVADINGDGKVNIVDFSIMLFQWTR